MVGPRAPCRGHCGRSTPLVRKLRRFLGKPLQFQNLRTSCRGSQLLGLQCKRGLSRTLHVIAPTALQVGKSRVYGLHGLPALLSGITVLASFSPPRGSCSRKQTPHSHARAVGNRSMTDTSARQSLARKLYFCAFLTARKTRRSSRRSSSA